MPVGICLVPVVYYNGSHIPWFIFISKGLYFLYMMNCSQKLLHKSCILGDNILFHRYKDFTTIQCYRIQSMAYQINDILCKNCFINTQRANYLSYTHIHVSLYRCRLWRIMCRNVWKRSANWNSKKCQIKTKQNSKKENS